MASIKQENQTNYLNLSVLYSIIKLKRFRVQKLSSKNISMLHELRVH